MRLDSVQKGLNILFNYTGADTLWTNETQVIVPATGRSLNKCAMSFILGLGWELHASDVEGLPGNWIYDSEKEAQETGDVSVSQSEMPDPVITVWKTDESL